MPAVESVEYNSVTFRRYPDSERRADREYYRPSGDHIQDGVEALHREVWKDANGVDEVPAGHAVHHIDGDTANNDPSNLKCLTHAEHMRQHPDIGLTEEAIGKGIEAAKEWHKSEEGREWHRQHGKKVAEAVEGREKECDQCGEPFTDNSIEGAGRFCSNACKAKARRERGDDDEERICEACRRPFTINKYSDTRSCSRRCAGALVSWAKRI